MFKKLTKREIAKHLKALGESWAVSEEGDTLNRTFTFPDFIEAYMFVTRIVVHSEVLQQYPRILIEHTQVTLTMRGMSTIGLTKDNFKLAEQISIVYALSTTNSKKSLRQK